MHACMHGWTDGRRDEWMDVHDGWMDVCIHLYKYRCMYICICVYVYVDTCRYM